MRYRADSEYPSSSHFQRLAQGGINRWRFRLNVARAQKAISPACHDVGLALVRHLARDGRCDPSHSTLAKAARVCRRTVVSALQRLKACGLVEWTRRMMRTTDGARQISSAFRLLLGGFTWPSKPECKRRAGEISLEISTPENKERPPAPVARDPDAAEALRRIAARRTAEANAAWLASRGRPRIAREGT